MLTELLLGGLINKYVMFWLVSEGVDLPSMSIDFLMTTALVWSFCSAVVIKKSHAHGKEDDGGLLVTDGLSSP